MKHYLVQTASNKSELIIKGAKSQVQKTIEKEIKSFNYELVLFSKSKEELEDDLEKFNLKKDTNEKNLYKFKRGYIYI
ncbi:MAG: hypothetical protein ACNI22_04625 [Halarcobacter sp.]